MKSKPHPSQERLHELFEYRDDGNLIWKKCKSGIRKDMVAGSLNPTTNHHQVLVDGKIYNLHRMIFMYHYGYLTSGLEIDHIDTDKSNNRIENLREVTRAQNSMNTKIKSTNTSGVKGVYWNKSGQKWVSRIKVNGKNEYLGSYNTIEEAKEVITAARNNLHGDFARHE
jgi:hypothetical protein